MPKIYSKTYFKIIWNIFVFQLEIIDACVSYIEALQSQLELVKPISHHHELAETDTESEDEVDLMNNNNDVQNDGKNAQLWLITYIPV